MAQSIPPEGLHLVLNAQFQIVQADERLADYHERLGGTPDGVFKVAPIVTLAILSSTLGMRVHRGVRFTIKKAQVKCWADIQPNAEGYAIVITDLVEQPLIPDNSDALSEAAPIAADGWLSIDSNNIICGGELPKDIAVSDQISGFIGALWPELLRPVDDRNFADKIARGHFPIWQALDGQEFCFWPVSKTPWAVKIIPSQAEQILRWYFFEVDSERAKRLEKSNSEKLMLPIVDTPHKRLFVHSVAPALRAPVVRIMANARTISDEKNGPLRNQYADYARDIAQAAEHLLALIDDASDLEVVDGEDFNYVREDVDLCDVARRAAGLLRVKAQSRKIIIDAPKAGEHLMCRAEFRRTLQIVLNLLGNAIRYGPDDAVIRLNAEARDGMAMLTVSDQGKGISAEDQAIIFDKFERLGRAGDGGSGLGLYISLRLARAMGGDIMIDSAPGEGARFTVQLPQKDLAEEA